MTFRHLLSLVFSAKVLGSLTVCAGLIYQEGVQGDLSGNHLAPTPLAFANGLNIVAGTMGADAGDGIPLDRDFFTFTLAPDQILTSIQVRQFNPPGASFYAIAAGTSIAIDSSAQHLSNLLIRGNGEILDALANAPYSGGLGLSSPLGPGTYTVWFQELASVVTYDFAYTVAPAPVPEPGTAACGLFVAVAALGQRRRHAHRAPSPSHPSLSLS